MKPVLRQYALTSDCTTVALQDRSTIPTNLPSFALFKVSMYGKDAYHNLLINNSSVPTFNQFISGTVKLINSTVLGATYTEDKLLELNCGIIQIDYHWFYTTSKEITVTEDKNEIVGTNLDIKDSVYIGGEVYTINKGKSTTSKLITNEVIPISGNGLLTYGEYSTTYVVNDCAILRGHTVAIGDLSLLDCSESIQCLNASDKSKSKKLLDDLINLQSAKVKLSCGDVLSANQLIKDLCSIYAKECYNANNLLSDCGCEKIIIEGCTTCE